MDVLGRPIPRVDAREKVTGRAPYVDDLPFPEALWGATVRTEVAAGRLRQVTFAPGAPWDEIVVVTARDIPGRNVVRLFADDQPCLVHDAIGHREEAVVLLAHRDRDVLRRAAGLVRLDVEPAAPVSGLERATRTLAEHTLERGDAEAALASADVVVEGVYTTGAQEHAYLEPQGMVADPGRDGTVTITGSLQCPYYVRPAVALVLGVEDHRVRVAQAVTGGGFGGKEEYPSMLACHAALLARQAGRPVKMVYERTEDMRATTKRHPSRTRLRLGLQRDGTFVALDAELVLDGGAYVTLSPVVLSRAVIHAPGPYRWPSVRVRGRALATSLPPHGAFRGFGAPQVIFALETHVDRAARRVGLDPVELRRRNLLRPGERTATGQAVDPGVDPRAVLEAALAASGLEARRRAAARANATDMTVRRGVGVATFFHGAGFTGRGEDTLASEVALRVAPDGVVEILASSTEIGQGTATTHVQIVAEALGLPLAMVRRAPVDTALVPDSGPTVASRTAMVVGGLLAEAAARLRAELAPEAGLGARATAREVAALTAEEFRTAALAYLERHGSLETKARYARRGDAAWDERTFQGDAYAGHAWAAYVAEVAVDVRTGQATVEAFTAAQEVGRVLNPVTARGQIEGGVAQGIGWALYEDVAWRDGVMANARLADYILPTSADVPDIRTVFLEVPHPAGPFGAKGIGELPMDGPAPAIVNAINAALSSELSAVPALPEQVLLALDAAEAAGSAPRGAAGGRGGVSRGGP